jgi:murein DD-endopeptidase MepM/ murein hydrolase activator NlpD
MAVTIQNNSASACSLKSMKVTASCLLLSFALPIIGFADNGEIIPTPVPYATYILVPGKLTGEDFLIKKENLDCKIFSFDQFRSFPKPAATVNLPVSLRGGYRPHDIFGHDDFESDGNGNVATGWVPQGNGNFIIFPDEANDHSPQWVPERTRLIRVPLVKQYGDTVVNAYDLALGLDRFNSGDAKSQSIEFKIVPITDDNGKAGKRLVPSAPLTEGVYYAYSLPSDKNTENYGFLFAVGNPSLTISNPTTVTIAQQTGTGNQSLKFKFPLADYTPYTAPVASVFDHSGSRYTANNEVVAFTGEKGTVRDTVEPPVSLGGRKLYSYKKADGSAFSCNGNYQGTGLTGSETLNYDGHPGWDYAVSNGTPVYAVADGQVVSVTEDSSSGKYIRLQHGTDYQTEYLHLSEQSVVENAAVLKGQLIGKSGNSGGVSPHLHFEVKKLVGGNWVSVDPYGWAGVGSDPYQIANIKLWEDNGVTQLASPLTTPTSAINGIQQVNTKMADSVLDYALLSQAIYDAGTSKFKAPNGWEAVDPVTFSSLLNTKKAFYNDPINDFTIGAFIKGKSLVLIFKGTNPKNIVDWSTDFFAAMGKEPGQYAEALNWVGNAIQRGENLFNLRVSLTGHSLGGGLATYAALHFDKPAVIFNAAPIGPGMLADIQGMEEKKRKITNIDMTGDPVSGLGGQIGSIYTLEVPAAVRAQLGAEWQAVEDAKHGLPFISNLKEIGAGSALTLDSLIQLHSMDNIVLALQLLPRSPVIN